jgi:hypothetical protein
MSIRIRLSELLREYTLSQGIVEVNGDTILDCIKDLIRQYPGAGKWLFDSEGRLLVLITINQENFKITRERLNDKVKDGDEIFLYMSLGGG